MQFTVQAMKDFIETGKFSREFTTHSLGARAPPVEREAAVAAALETLRKSPRQRLEFFAKARNRVLALIRAHRTEIAGMEFERGMTEAERAAAGITGPPPAQAEIAREKVQAPPRAS